MEHIVDFSRYSIDQPNSAAWRNLVSRCQADLAKTGMFNLPGFLRPDQAHLIATDLAPKFATEAFHHERDHNIYFKDTVDGLPEDHPALQRLRTSNRTLCADQLGENALIQLYDWPPFIQFLAETLGKSALFAMKDALARVNVMAYGNEEALNWHFDRSEFTTTLLLQEPDAGGVFEYAQDLRTASDPNYEGVAKLISGSLQPKQVSLSSGTLSVFLGANTAHRVTPVMGSRARMIAVFSYFDRPGVVFSKSERLGFYGREA